MAEINGSSLLLYADGTVIACQKGCTISVEQDLPDSTNKESAGWARHINGLLGAKIELTALRSTTGLSAKELMDYIINRQEILFSAVGLGYPIVGKVNISSLSFTAPQEGVMEISGSFTVNEELYILTGDNANIITDWENVNYDTFTDAGGAITSAISSGGTEQGQTNTFDIADDEVYKVALFLTLNSGQAPYIALTNQYTGDISNRVTLTAGLNLVTLTATATKVGGVIRLVNTEASNYLTSVVYAWKQA